MDLTLDVPGSFAVSLFAEDLAGLPLHDRSGGGAAQTAIEVIGVLADTTSIVVAVAAIPEIARRLLAWVRGSDARQDGRTHPTEIRISTPAGVVQIRVPQSPDGAAIDISVAEVRSMLELAASKQVK